MAAPRRTKIEKIEHLSSRQVTFSKRRKGLFNKAEDFSERCHADIAVMVFSNTKKMYEFSSTNMDDILSRYYTKVQHDDSDSPMEESSEEKSLMLALTSSSSGSSDQIRLLQEKIRALNLDCLRLMGKELEGMSLRDLNELEKQIREGIEAVEKRKIQVQNYEPVYMLEDSPSDGNTNNNNVSGSSSSGVSDCTELVRSTTFVDTDLRL